MRKLPNKTTGRRQCLLPIFTVSDGFDLDGVGVAGLAVDGAAGEEDVIAFQVASRQGLIVVPLAATTQCPFLGSLFGLPHE